MRFKVSIMVLSAIMILGNVVGVRFLIDNKHEVCIYENLPKNEALATQVLVDLDAKDFELIILHMDQEGKTLDSSKVRLYNDLNVFVHHEGRMV